MKFPKSAFRCDRKGDYYDCPARQRSVVTGRKEQQRGRTYQHCGEAPCYECVKRGQCTSSSRGRLVKRYANEELKEQLRARMQEPRMRREYEKRRHMVEPVFARIKEHQGLKRFRRKGLKQVQVEFALHAAVHNIGRLLALVPAPAPFCRQSKGYRASYWPVCGGFQALRLSSRFRCIQLIPSSKLTS